MSQLLAKMEQYEVRNEASFKTEESLRADGINFDILPKDKTKEDYLSANTKVFSEDEIEDLEEQEIVLENEMLIRAELNTPIEIEDLEDFIQNNVLYGDQYAFWEHNKTDNKIIYYQKVNGKFILGNLSAQLVFNINKDNKIDYYEQTMLDPIETISDGEDVLSAFKALEILYRDDYIEPNSTIVNVEIGYYTISNEETTQVLTPTWYFVIERDGERKRQLVDAFYGTVIRSQQTEEN